jgi:hypothetical protein
VGTLPADIIVSNAPTEWQGKRWTMLMWPTIPTDRDGRMSFRASTNVLLKFVTQLSV